MSHNTPRLSLPVMQAAQAQKHLTHNEALERLDIAVQMTLEHFFATSPPATPAEGQAWAVGNGASGAWSGKAGKIASWRGGGWMFVTPADGWQAWARAQNEIRFYKDGVWTLPEAPAAPAPDFNNLAGLGVQATADAYNRMIVASDAVLMTHAGAGHQLKINKASAGDTASLVYQSNWGGRAEIGLAGNDDFSIKVSADGGTWTPAVQIDGGSGTVTLHQVLGLTPGPVPGGAIAGQIYFDAGDAVLRCYDGTTWRDLF